MMRSIFFCNETGLIKISLEATFLVCQIGLNNNILGKYRPNSKQLLKEMIINAYRIMFAQVGNTSFKSRGKNGSLRLCE